MRVSARKYQLVSILFCTVFASTLEHAYIKPSRLVCPQCDIEKRIPTEVTHTNHLLYITCPSIMMEDIQQTEHTDLQIQMQGSVPLHVHEQACMHT